MGLALDTRGRVLYLTVGSQSSGEPARALVGPRPHERPPVLGPWLQRPAPSQRLPACPLQSWAHAPNPNPQPPTPSPKPQCPPSQASLQRAWRRAHLVYYLTRTSPCTSSASSLPHGTFHNSQQPV
ncbi:uncharacterized protein PADG_11289 [Paracoccidioides brasiliensis Pb18]|uniref:Uncharacterized protein n=1 Tax=Paracoccidioides brasiliensis (strain Pb18) TaxID=502780 RepID=A0A0A0HVQ4_PARBD|nr:uncharacterized protein PADG_11289 [Paracoccidioides brasiliensis Pb18]KGM92468.1 hypothetical protein PADG_11289 [Paracoccidioides brasiliensis Pb18]